MKLLVMAAVKATDEAEGVIPSAGTVSSGQYPISRELYWFFNGKPTGELAKLVNWTLSDFQRRRRLALEAAVPESGDDTPASDASPAKGEEQP